MGFDNGRCEMHDDRYKRLQTEVDKINNTIDGKEGIWQNISHLDIKLTKLTVYATIGASIFAIIGGFMLNNLMNTIYGKVDKTEVSKSK